jgi:ABC-type branched-subunit amino acid transport system substrate-binding protein
MVLAAVALTASAGAATKEPYRFQVSAHMTGAGSDFYAPRVEGLRVFFDDLNARGGVNGRPVRMTINDNRGDATVATTQAQSFVDDSSTLFNILASSSATIAPFASVTTPKSMPSFYLGPCYPPAAGPGGAPNWFCLGPNPITDGYTELGIYFGLLKKYGIRQAAPAYVSSNAPGNQAIFTRFIRPIAEQRGAKTGGYLTALPFDQTDFGSTARAIIDSGANSVISYSIPSQQNGVAQALVSAGFKGPIFVIGNAPTTHAALMRIKDPDVYSVEWNAPFSENLKLHKTIQDAAKRRKASFPADDLANGWMLGMMIEAGLKKCGGTCTRESFLAGLNGGVRLSDPAVLGMWGPSKVEWTSTVHTTAYKSYVLVHYDAKQKNVVRVGKWIRQMERPFAFPR